MFKKLAEKFMTLKVGESFLWKIDIGISGESEEIVMNSKCIYEFDSTFIITAASGGGFESMLTIYDTTTIDEINERLFEDFYSGYKFIGFTTEEECEKEWKKVKQFLEDHKNESVFDVEWP